jgi:hypothetical protein
MIDILEGNCNAAMIRLQEERLHICTETARGGSCFSLSGGGLLHIVLKLGKMIQYVTLDRVNGGSFESILLSQKELHIDPF